MEYHFDLPSIEKETGLNENFLRRIIKDLPEIVEAYGQKKAHNKIFFSDNGLQLFINAGHLKRDGVTLPNIISSLKQGLPNKVKEGAKLAAEPQSNENQFSYLTMFESIVKTSQDQSERAFEAALKSREELINQQKSHIEDLRGSLRLLTDGRSPEEINREKEEQQRRIIQAETEAKNYAQQLNAAAERAKRLEDELNTTKKTHLDTEQNTKIIIETARKAEQEALKKLQETQEREQQAHKKAELLETKALLLSEMSKQPWYAFERKKLLQKQINDLSV